jgi:molybdopterin-guanine dinucleotide biosynthesis protein A
MIAGLILAGGQASRMGGADKPLLSLGRRTILDILLDRLRPQVDVLAISANGDPGRYAGLGFPVLADDVPGRGPLGGILRGLGWARAQGAEALLTLPGDTPFIPTDLARRLSPPPCCAENASGVHWPVALWAVSCRDALDAWLANDASCRVAEFGASIGLRRAWFDDPGDPFHNVNTPADLEAARRNV